MVNSRFFSQYVQNNKAADNDWFRLESNKEGTRWFGKCWHIHNLLKYEFDVEFDVSNIGLVFFLFYQYLLINLFIYYIDTNNLSNYCSRISTTGVRWQDC